MKQFGYSLRANGFIAKCGYVGEFDYYADGTEPWQTFECTAWQLDPDTGEWIYYPELNPTQNTVEI